MGIFDFLKRPKKTEEPPTAPSIIEGVVLLADDYMVHWVSVLNDLRETWGCTVGTPLGTQEFTWFVEIDGYKVGFDTRRTPIPPEEIHKIANFSYFWENAAKEATTHKVHIALCIMHTGNNPLTENLIFTKIVTSVLRHTASIGFYMPSRCLLIKKDFYINHAEVIAEHHLPVYNWIYFGSIINQVSNSHSFYTNGLKDFNKKEIEIDNSLLSSRELSKILVDTVVYVLSGDVVLTDGQSIEVESARTAQIQVSNGIRLEGDTIKLLC